MHLERVVIVTETRFCPDEWGMPGYALRHLEEPLRYSGIVDNVDNFYYGDYPNPDEALFNYCLQKKPQVVLLSVVSRELRKQDPSPEAVGKITHQLHIPTVMFWWDIHSDFVAGVLERYLRSVTLNMISGADASSHKPLPLEGTNYVYAGVTYDESIFNKPESVRDIPTGFLGTLIGNRSQWIYGLRKCGIPVYTAGGCIDDGKLPDLSTDEPVSGWMPYEKYLTLLSRLKIALNFSLIGARQQNPIVLFERGPALERLWWFAATLKRWSLVLAKKPSNAKLIIREFMNITAVLLRKPRYVIRDRVWETLWCRTFLLEEDNPITSLYFEPYIDYVPFTTLKDLVDKIKFYLEHDEERERIRMQGRATVEKYCNSRVYWANLFETIGIQSDRLSQHHPGDIWNKAYFDNWYLSANVKEQWIHEQKAKK